MSTFTKLLLGAVAALSIGSATLYAQQREPAGPGYGRGPDMMYGYGYQQGPRGGWDRQGYGAGMMGGGYGTGMMGGGYGMMGSGMMGGGYGMMGPGMMGGVRGYGMGPAVMGGGALSALDLSDSQRKQVLTIQDGIRKKNWALMGSMHDEMSNLRNGFWTGEQRDRAAILAANKRMFDLRQQMLENALDAADQIEKVLTPQQRETLRKRSGPAWLIDEEE